MVYCPSSKFTRKAVSEQNTSERDVPLFVSHLDGKIHIWQMPCFYIYLWYKETRRLDIWHEILE